MNREAIIGSRKFRPLERVEEYVSLLPDGTVVVTGGAPGVDSASESAARARSRLADPDIIAADWDLHGKIAGKLRNWPLVGTSGHVQAFWDGWSNGTAHAVTAAVALGVPVTVELAHGFRVPDFPAPATERAS